MSQTGRCRVRLAIRVMVSSTRAGSRGRRSCQESGATSSAGSTPTTEQRGKPQGNNTRGFLIVSAYLVHGSNNMGVSACSKLPWTADVFLSIRCCFKCFQEEHIRFVFRGWDAHVIAQLPILLQQCFSFLLTHLDLIREIHDNMMHAKG